jgi:hypothetical protein
MLGFTYLINLDVGFSLWFFALAVFVITGICNMTGFGLREPLDVYSGDSANPLFAHLGMGVIIIIVLWSLWGSREHLRQVFRKAMGKASELDDSREIIPYSVAFWGLIMGVVLLGIWLAASGLSAFWVVIFLLVSLILFLGITRIVAESGLAEARFPLIPSSFLISGFGSPAIGPVGLMSLAFSYIWTADTRTFVLASSIHGLKLAEIIRGGRRILFWALLIAVIVSLAGSVGSILKLGYLKGAVTTNEWFFKDGPQQPFNFIATKLGYPTGPNWGGWAYTGIGVGLGWLLLWLSRQFISWPLHPLGVPLAGTMLMQRLWFTVFLGWLAKYIILRYGGAKYYQRFLPFFLGLILGQCSCMGIWVLIDFLTGKVGNYIYWL